MLACTGCGLRLVKPFVVRLFHEDGSESEVRSRWPKNIAERVFVAYHDDCDRDVGTPHKYRRPPERVRLPVAIISRGRVWREKDVKVKRKGSRYLMVLPTKKW